MRGRVRANPARVARQGTAGMSYFDLEAAIERLRVRTGRDPGDDLLEY
jgi:hypothetical protein